MINTSLIAPLPGDQQAQPTFGNFSDAFRMGMQRADPLERLKRIQLEQGLQMQGFNLQKALEDRQRMVDGRAYAREVMPRIQEIIQGGDPVAAKTAMLGELAAHPELSDAPEFNSLAESVDKSIGFRNEQMKLQAQMNYYNRPSAVAQQAQDYAKARADLRSAEGGLNQLTANPEIIQQPVGAGFGPIPMPSQEWVQKHAAQSEKVQQAQDVVGRMDTVQNKSEASDVRLARLLEERDTAVDNGDVGEAQRLQEQINYLKNQRINRPMAAKLNDIVGMRRIAYKALQDLKPGSKEYQAKKTELDDLEKQMSSILMESGAAPAQSQPKTGTIGRFQYSVE